MSNDSIAIIIFCSGMVVGAAIATIAFCTLMKIANDLMDAINTKVFK